MSRAGKPTDNPVNEALNGWIKEELFIDFRLEECRTRYAVKDERIAPLSCLPQNNAILSNVFIEWKCILPFHKLIVVNAENGENFPTGKF